MPNSPRNKYFKNQVNRMTIILKTRLDIRTFWL